MNPLKVCPQCGTEYPANARFCEIDGTALRTVGAEQDMVGSIVSDRYCILKKLGEGGMGQVYLAEHVKMGRKSALKVMHPGMVKDVDAISRFNREAANASRISHPNVAAVYDFGETSDGIIFLAMEFVDGPPLTKVIEQAGALPPARAAEIVRQTAEALAVAHDMGIVHRDLKPDNIMIARTRDGGDLVKVVDFGIAKAAGNDAQKVTKTGLVVGTPEYMSPEQLAGEKLDGRSDIYALALVAFNMLTGYLPFPADSAQESMIMRLTDRPKSLADMRPDIAWPADVQQVMDRALERDVTLRYQTATEFGRDLYRTIERMPETGAATVGTQMMSVPPTRVADAGAAPAGNVAPGVAAGVPPTAAPVSGGGTLSVPTPLSSPPVTQAAAPPRRKNMIPIVGAIAVVVIAAAVAVPKLMDGRSGAAVDSLNASGTTNGTTNGTTSGTTSGTTAAGTPSTTAPPANGTSGESTQGTKPPATGVDRLNKAKDPAPAVSVDQRLATLESDASDSTRADNVMKQLSAIWPTLTTDDERARGNYIRYLAVAAKGDGGKACTYIKEAVRLTSDAVKRSRWQIVVDNLEGCS